MVGWFHKCSGWCSRLGPEGTDLRGISGIFRTLVEGVGRSGVEDTGDVRRNVVFIIEMLAGVVIRKIGVISACLPI